ncbi:helix-turn-helix domain-containing protein [Prolixibacteraceae bacterium Z1-6]|uniref:Helix-turn-helix domain-containing protein n=1 Tax=Draconibacterium aestuarii TaxID=2998507 RepID=A0A9X3F9T0_9BACT|nr:helix-turn-helix domain-containing protein [Prolixibacteraceae bacterium Z1-6]
MADQIRLSHSQIHRKLKEITNQSASQFIREIRLNKAKEILEKELYTVSEVAYKVGFANTTYFSKCFHEYFGYPPGELRKHALASIGITGSGVHKQIASGTKGELIKNSAKKSQLFILSIIVIVVLAFFGYRYFGNEMNKSTVNVKSIAVCPLRNYSDDNKNQHIADGIIEDIINRLSQISALKVKSLIPCRNALTEEKSLAELAREYNVSHVLDGSFLLEEDEARIIIHLYESKTDKYIWSYKPPLLNLNEILPFISDVAKQVAGELQIFLLNNEIEKIEKEYTENTEAYNLYLTGRYFWNQTTQKSLEQSIEYFNKSLDKDPNYSLAYAGLAMAYSRQAWYGWCPLHEGYRKGKECAMKALSIDKKLSEAHTVLAYIACGYDRDWKVAERELKLALELNPNYAYTHHCYAGYLMFAKEKNEEARKHINRALDLNPFLFISRWYSCWFYYREGKYNEALQEINKLMELYPERDNLYKYVFLIRFKEGNYVKALEAISKDKSFIATLEKELVSLDDIYVKSGIEGVIRLLILHEKTQEEVLNYDIARYYALLNDKNTALDYLEKGLESGQSNLCKIKFDPDFEKLRDEPRFLFILTKLNLGGY